MASSFEDAYKEAAAMTAGFSQKWNSRTPAQQSPAVRQSPLAPVPSYGEEDDLYNTAPGAQLSAIASTVVSPPSDHGDPFAQAFSHTDLNQSTLSHQDSEAMDMAGGDFLEAVPPWYQAADDSRGVPELMRERDASLASGMGPGAAPIAVATAAVSPANSSLPVATAVTPVMAQAAPASIAAGGPGGGPGKSPLLRGGAPGRGGGGPPGQLVTVVVRRLPFGMKVNDNLVVTGVDAGSAAEEEGVPVGARLLSVAAQPVTWQTWRSVLTSRPLPVQLVLQPAPPGARPASPGPASPRSPGPPAAGGGLPARPPSPGGARPPSPGAGRRPPPGSMPARPASPGGGGATGRGGQGPGPAMEQPPGPGPATQDGAPPQVFEEKYGGGPKTPQDLELGSVILEQVLPSTPKPGPPPRGKDLAVVLAKLDAMDRKLDDVNQRLERVEQKQNLTCQCTIS